MNLVEQATQIAPNSLYGTQTKQNYYQQLPNFTRNDANAARAVVNRLGASNQGLGEFFSYAGADNVSALRTDLQRSRSFFGNKLSATERRRFQDVDRFLGSNESARFVGGQIATRRNALAKNGVNPEDTEFYAPKDVIPTLTSPKNMQLIQQTAARYGIEPELLAGVVAAEMDFDHDRNDVFQDGFGRNAPWLLDVFQADSGAGVASVHLPTLKQSIEYIKKNPDRFGSSVVSAASKYDLSTNNRSTFAGSVESAAIVTAALRDWKRANGDVGQLTTEDMASIWGAYRTGVGGFSIQEDKKTVPVGQGGFKNGTDFALNRANGAQGLPREMQIGGNAYQSLPYFKFFQSAFAQRR
ncbi:MAG: hypothetical protein AAFV29_02000 [Myxococcota bacterium]